ncbi:MAG: arsenate reductase ArsC [Bacteroidia bacterium]|nr:arsenate reductase ArsC [Bacteroidia bacterium]
MKILILCTGNSCRSPMAEGFLKSFDNKLEVYSAGTFPADFVNSNSVKVMKEVGIDISAHKPRNVNEFLSESFDYVITVCDSSKEICPVFAGKVKHFLYHGFEDPYMTSGTPEEILSVYRRVRDEIKDWFYNFYISKSV